VSIVNRRNALLGWATWQAAKRLAAQRARAAAQAESGRPVKKLIVGALAAGAAVAAFIFLRRDDEDTELPE
jgi:hypothetical protein